MENSEIPRRRLLRENMRWITAYILNGVLMDILSAVVIAAALILARDRINHQVMSSGTFGSFVGALLLAYTPLKRIGVFYQQLEQARGATVQVFDFLALEEEQSEKPGAAILPAFSRSVELKGVSFAYNPRVSRVAKRGPDRASR